MNIVLLLTYLRENLDILNIVLKADNLDTHIFKNIFFFTHFKNLVPTTKHLNDLSAMRLQPSRDC